MICIIRHEPANWKNQWREQAESKNSKLTHGSLFQKNKNPVVTKIKVNPLSASVALI